MPTELVTLAGGCFWCVEAVLLPLKGVEKVVSGYIGGDRPNPSYEDICTGRTGHAEAVEVTFDSGLISFHDLLEIFFATHDPTTLNRQGNDAGTQYRSAIFYHSPQQKEIAEQTIAELNAAGTFPDPIVTQVAPAETFYPAETYHQNYYELHPAQPYCQVVISPKVAKLRQKFAERLK
jgi:peptide-methionine (S)-S-oxide reductase